MAYIRKWKRLLTLLVSLLIFLASVKFSKESVVSYAFSKNAIYEEIANFIKESDSDLYDDLKWVDNLTKVPVVDGKVLFDEEVSGKIYFLTTRENPAVPIGNKLNPYIKVNGEKIKPVKNSDSFNFVYQGDHYHSVFWVEVNKEKELEIETNYNGKMIVVFDNGEEGE